MKMFRSNPMKQRGRPTPIPTLCSILFIILIAAFATGQTVQPIIQEYEGVGKGSFDVINQGDSPLVVTIAPESFTVKESGEMWFQSLDPGIHVKLSAMSLRLGPHETSRVFYTASAEQLPAWFVIYATFGVPPRKEITSLNLRLELPHVVYLLPKHGGIAKGDLAISAIYDVEKQSIHCTVENMGGNFGRVMQIQAVGATKRQDGPSGGVFPHSRRAFEIEWKNPEVPQKVLLQFNNLKVEQTVATKE